MGTRIDDLTDAAKPVAKRLKEITAHSVKKILSAGVIVLDKLPPEEIQKAIAEANGLPSDEAELYGPGETYLSPEKKEFRRAVLQILRDSGLIGKAKKPPKQAKSSKSA